jgi:hypothetical protein
LEGAGVVTDREAHYIGAFIAAVGLGTMAASLVRLFFPGWEATAYLSVFGAGCGLPLVLVVGATTYVWAQGELSANRVAELDARVKLARLQTPLQQATTAPRQPSAAEQDVLVRAHHWRIAAHRFLTAGDRWGFGIRTLTRKGAVTKVVSWTGWGEMTRVLRDAGVLSGAGDGTKWADDWSYHRWLDEKDRVALPHPDKEPPDVEVSGHNATTPQGATAPEQP